MREDYSLTLRRSRQNRRGVEKLRAEITQLRSEAESLRAELQQERELADRLAAQLDVDRHLVSAAAMVGFNHNDGDWPDRLFVNNGVITRHLTAHATRRNK